MSKVSRSTYQKLAEENKRLIKDIRTIVMSDKSFADRIEVISKYRKQFQKEDFFNSIMKEYATGYIANNPDEFKFLKNE